MAVSEPLQQHILSTALNLTEIRREEYQQNKQNEKASLLRFTIAKKPLHAFVILFYHPTTIFTSLFGVPVVLFHTSFIKLIFRIFHREFYYTVRLLSAWKAIERKGKPENKSNQERDMQARKEARH